MQRHRILIAGAVAAVTLTVGGFAIASAASTSNSNHAAGATSNGRTGGGAQAAASATVHTATATVRGVSETILVNSHDLPLYLYKGDTATTSHVTGELAALWPPLVATSPSESGLTGELTVVTTRNGKQVAYNGHFLYTFVQDGPSKVTGQGVQNFFVATPGLGSGATAGPSSTQAPAPATGYSY